MGNISSINIKKTNAIQTKHNARDEDFKPSYLLESGGKAFECNRSSLEAELLRDRMIKEAQERYKQRTGQKFQAKSYLASAVINLKADSTMQDVERVAQHLQKKHKFQCYQIAIHRDEGHIDENGKECINHHAHLEFVTLDKETGCNMWQTKHIGVGKLRELQDEVAQILQMERGVDKRLSGAKRVEPRKYAIMKEREKAERKADLEKIKREKIIPLEIVAEFAEEKNKKLQAENATLKEENKKLQEQQLLDTKEVKEMLESFRKQCIGKGLPKEFFRALSAEKQSPKQSTKQELELFCADLLRAYEEERKAREKAENERARLEAELESKNAQNRDFAPQSSAAPVQSKTTETTQSVETTQETKPKIDAPVKEQKPAKISIGEAFDNALTSANCKTKMYWHTSEEKSIYVKDISAQKAEIIKDKMESQGFFVAYNEDKSNRTTLNGVKWNITLIVSSTKEAFEKAKEWLQSRFGSLIYKTPQSTSIDDIDTKLQMLIEGDKKLDERKEIFKAELSKVEQMKEQVKKAVYNQRETPKRDLGMSR